MSSRWRARCRTPDGVYVVPAFVGLGAPYWDARARGAIVGLTRGSTAAHVARAALDAMAYQTRELLEAMRRTRAAAARRCAWTAARSGNDLLMQFQADILDVPVQRPVVRETTALGAAYLAGLAIGFWRDQAELAGHWALDREFTPAMPAERRDRLYAAGRRRSAAPAMGRRLRSEPAGT